jgi:N-acetylneuraminic acid mutarotase
MSKNAALLLVLFLLTASCLTMTKPAFSSTEATENAWMTKAPMHFARGCLGVAAVNGKIYAIGGSNTKINYSRIISGDIVGYNEEYDPAADKWTVKAQMPTPRALFATAVYQNKIYCMGGITFATATYQNKIYRIGGFSFFGTHNFTGINEVYDPASDTWETKAPMPTPRVGLTASVVDGKIYLIGGISEDGSLLNTNEVYNPENDTWTTKAPMPTATEQCTSAVVDNKIYVIGGGGAGDKNQMYDPQTDSWVYRASPPFALTGAASTTSGEIAPERIYVFSWGRANEIYYAQNDSWTVGAPVPTSREGFGVASVDDQFYIIGGIITTYVFPFSDALFNETPLDVNEQYTPVGYGTIAPKISIQSPLNQSYKVSNVSLSFSVKVFSPDKAPMWLGYSLDEEQNVTITGNTTLAELSNGLHTVTVYANDTFGNMGASQTVDFTVAVPEPFPTATVVAASAAAAVIVAGALIVHSRKRRTNRSHQD